MLSIIVNYARYVIVALKLGKFLEDYTVNIYRKVIGIV